VLVSFSFSSYDTLALHALVDDTIEKTTAVVTEGRAVVGVLLELVLRPRVLRYYTITPCTHTRRLSDLMMMMRRRKEIMIVET